MINAKLKSENIFYFTIDTSIFGESVITKGVYLSLIHILMQVQAPTAGLFLPTTCLLTIVL